MILNKRIKRDFKDNILKYLGLFFLIVLGHGIVVGGIAGNGSIITTVEKYDEIANVEEGEFTTLTGINNDVSDEIKDKGIDIEEQFYRDVKVSDDSTLRIYKNRNNINILNLDKGKNIEDDKDIILEKHYAEQYNYNIGDDIEIAGKDFNICGIGSSPDYNLVKLNPSDVSSNVKQFSVAFISENAFEDVKNISNEDISDIVYSYSYKLNNVESPKEFKNYLADNTVLTYFIKSVDNSRISAYKDESVITNNGSLVFGIIFLILMAYVISNFTIHKIESESAVIGTLYSMGYLKKELVRHFMILPVIIMLTASVVGVGIGFGVFADLLAADSIAYYSFPQLEIKYPIYLIAYGILVPILITIVVNYFVMNRRLSQEPLSLLRRERKEKKISNINLGNMSFFNKYRIRQITREGRGNIILFFGLFFGTLLLMLGIAIYGSVKYYVDHTADDIKYNYVYALKSPLEEIPSSGEKAITTSLSEYCDILGGDMDVTIQGVSSDSSYFDFNCNGNENDIYISDSVSRKFNLKVGDSITLTDSLENKDYEFTVKEIVPFSNGLYAFMNIDNMREKFDYDEDYYNTILSADSINIDKDYLVSTTTIDDIKNEAQAVLDRMMMMISIMVSVSIILFVIVTYILLKIMIEKSKFSISLIKIFGYNNKEINKLYLGSSTYTVILSIIISIPVSKIILNKIYPYLVSNVSTGMFAYISLPLYFLVVAVIVLTYLFVSMFLRRQLRKISLAEVLKDRE